MIKPLLFILCLSASYGADSFGLTSSWSTSSTTDAQGVATDGTHIWYSDSTNLYKYTKAGSLVTSRAVTGDNPTTKDQINGLFYKGGVLYVSAAKIVAGVGTSYIVEYDPTTLAYITAHTLTGDRYSEGCAFFDGYWWVCYHAHKLIAQYDTSWNFVAEFALTFTINGNSGLGVGGTYGTQGYDGILWKDGFLYLNIHEIYNQKFCDRYRWTGSGFSEDIRIPHLTSQATQGIVFDPTEPGGTIWWAVRNYSGLDSVIKGALIIPVIPTANTQIIGL